MISKIIVKPKTDNELSEHISKNIDKLDESKKIFENDDYCPYCYQKFENNYKEKVLGIIKSIQNDEVEGYKNKLEEIKINSINGMENIDEYNIISDELVKNIKEIMKDCSECIEEYNSKIDMRKMNPFIEFSQKVELLNIYDKIENKINEYKKSAIEINKKIDEMENDKKDKEKLKNDLLEINKKLGFFDIFDDDSCKNIFGTYDVYSENNNKIKELEDKIKELEKEKEKYDEKIKDFKNKKKTVKIACDKMNEFLSYIFYSKDRVRIEIENDRYVLKVNGKDVKPNEVSTGERNIVALCYFFLDIMKGEDEDKLYTKERLYVIDDPVSSFDYGNRIGIMSFLRWQFDLIIKNNYHSRILFFSHDIFVIQDMIKCFVDIYGGKYSDMENKVLLYEIREEQFKKLKNNIDLYTALLEDVFDYVDSGNFDDNSIGNDIRRLLESFSTFSYGIGIAEISWNDKILDLLKDKNLINFYKNSMYKLVLHGESHTKDMTKNCIGGYDPWNMVSKDEKIRVAKETLVFMYLLNPKHIEFKLKSKPDKIKKIEEWVAEIKDIANSKN